jgi:primosomal protein N' (replication factor Y)
MLDYKAPEGGCHLGAFEVPLIYKGLAWFGVQTGRLTSLSVIRCAVAPMADEMRQF